MMFKHSEVQQFHDRVIALKIGGLSDEERPIFALIDAYGWFRLLDGDQSSKIQEIISHLLSPELRSALKSWYGRHMETEANSVASELRENLSKLAGEKLG